MSGLPFKLKECSQECVLNAVLYITNVRFMPTATVLQERCQVSSHLLLYLHLCLLMSWVCRVLYEIEPGFEEPEEPKSDLHGRR
jgi:hypothetical protein